MKMVLEEIDTTIARLIPDNGAGPFYVTVDDLPKGCQIGDVVNLSYQKGGAKTIRRLEKVVNEKEDRLAMMKAKREALLKRNSK